MEEFESLSREAFQQFDLNKNGSIDLQELSTALKELEIKVPPYRIKLMLDEFDLDSNGTLSLPEFQKFTLSVKKKLDPDFLGKISNQFKGEIILGQQENALHSISFEEQRGYANWINNSLSKKQRLANILPLRADGEDLYEKCVSGVLLCELINSAVPGTIDERAVNYGKINPFQEIENRVLAINSASSIGVHVTSIHEEHFKEQNRVITLGLVWQVIKLGLLSHVNLKECPGLYLLLNDGETVEDLMRLTPEELLLRWVNYHLERAGIDKRIRNFKDDIKDSVAYSHLLHQISPKDRGVNTRALHESDLESRANLMLNEADKIDCRRFVTGKDVVAGNHKLNLAFVANLFNNYPGLDEAELPADIEIVEETREEKTFRNLMNSLGVDPFVNHLYTDLSTGLILFQLYNIIQPGVVDKKKITTKFTKLQGKWQRIENCEYAVELGKQIRLILVGIGGEDIYNGQPTLTLGLVWQLMRAYTLAILGKLSDGPERINDHDIIDWANRKLADGGRNRSLRSFQDASALKDGLLIIDLIDCIRPEAVVYEQVNSSPDSEADRLSNAKYAISIGRKIGAQIYALPEDIVECKHKMVLTIFACLMIVDLNAAN